MRINVIIILYFFVSCQNDAQQVACGKSKQGFKQFELQVRNEVLDTSVRRIKTFKKWVFKVNNSDDESIGYKIYTDDESIGVKSICVDSDYVYITDVYHTNIKLINIVTGELKSSKTLANLPPDESGIWLWDIAVFNNKVYVTTNGTSIYVFSQELQLVEEITVRYGKNHIENVSKSTIEIFVGGEQIQNDTNSNILLINENGHKTKLLKKSQKSNNSQVYVHGKPYKTFVKDGKNYFQNQCGIVVLEEPIPGIKEYSGAESINFNSTTLVYFDSTPTEFTLYVYKY